ncbi:MAG: hypothetical protein J0H39_00650 [Alphaproteobacteria bacterium]|nr:hypothetical protein [Alphaproteobacteria bacterium]
MESVLAAMKWLDSHQGLATWGQGFFTLLAATIAIIAARIAFNGAMAQADAAREQAKATVDVSQLDYANRRRAVAAAIWAELNDCRVRILCMARDLNSTNARSTNLLPLMSLPTEIYDANRSEVGLLRPFDAWQVVQCYKGLAHKREKIENILSKSDPLPNGFAAAFAGEILVVEGNVKKTLLDLANSAEFPQNMLDQINDAIKKSFGQ